MVYVAIRLFCGAGSLALVLSGHAARAQDVSASPTVGTVFDRQRTVAVSERVQSGFEEVGKRLDGFIIYPRITAVVAFDDNVRARSQDRQSDAALSIQPSINAVSDWTRHQVGLTASAGVTRFLNLKTENTETYYVQGEGRYDAGNEVRLYGFAGLRRDVERRNAPGALRNSLKPLAYQTATGGGQLTWQGGRMRLSANGTVARVTYGDLRTFDGAVLNSRDLNRTRYQASARAEYAITADLAVLVNGSVSKIDYNLQPGSSTPDRSARRVELLGGVSFEFTDLLRGEVALGYIKQDFRSPGIRDFSGFGGRARVEYFPTRLTTVTFDASRTLQEAGNPLAPSYRRTRAAIRVDHELYRYVLISGFADYETNQFQLPQRTERRPHVGLSGQYLVDRHVTLFARYDHLRITSRPANLGLRLTDNVLSIGVLFKP